MQQKAMLEADRSRNYRWMRLAVSVMLIAAIGSGLLAMAWQIWPPAHAWFEPGVLLLLQGAAAGLVAMALLIRHWHQATSLKMANNSDRQLQAMLSMFRVVKHELNNDMQVVVGNAELASMMLESESPACKPVENIREAATLAIDRIQQLTVFSSSGHTELSVVDLNAILRETVARLTNEMPAIVMFRLELEQLPNRIMADRSLLTLSLSYLIRLAGKSLFHGGEIVVRTCNLNGAANHTGEINITSEIFIVRGLTGAGNELGMASRDDDRRIRFARVLEQAQLTTTALVERSGATVMKGSLSASNESLIKMGFQAAVRSCDKNEIVLEDNT
ncbi:hypothetical protein ACUNV4_07395 [Granulosicoccus sp. 3-233]|uniref:hypothetical protein n=1 Tax=Granulosicoccus sp. 3-233 TaxID=3417969 RepID=UPI003D32AE0C